MKRKKRIVPLSDRRLREAFLYLSHPSTPLALFQLHCWVVPACTVALDGFTASTAKKTTKAPLFWGGGDRMIMKCRVWNCPLAGAEIRAAGDE